jgi:hypothetical protein
MYIRTMSRTGNNKSSDAQIRSSKNYRSKNRLTLNQNVKNYYNENKEKISLRRKELYKLKKIKLTEEKLVTEAPIIIEEEEEQKEPITDILSQIELEEFVAFQYSYQKMKHENAIWQKLILDRADGTKPKQK